MLCFHILLKPCLSWFCLLFDDQTAPERSGLVLALDTAYWTLRSVHFFYPYHCSIAAVCCSFLGSLSLKFSVDWPETPWLHHQYIKVVFSMLSLAESWSLLLFPGVMFPPYSGYNQDMATGTWCSAVFRVCDTSHQ